MGPELLVTVLGCGSSPGVPRIGGGWGACDPSNPKNRRRRCSILVQRFGDDGAATNVLVDTSPDLREQALDAGFGEVHGVLYTHAHADHLHGIDDLRGFFINMGQRIDTYADEATAERLMEAFGYCYATPRGSDYPPILTMKRVEPGVPVTVDGPGGPVTALPVTQVHGRINSLAYRFGHFCYSPDVSALDDLAADKMRNLDTWIVDALRYNPHPSHFSVREALDWIETLQPKRAYLTHMHIDLDYEELRGYLPPNVEPAFDGLQFRVTG